MRDIQEGDVIVIAQAQHGIQNRGSQRGIYHRHWLIRHNQARFNHISTRHHNPLPLPATQLMRILAQHILTIQANHIQPRLDHIAVFRLIVRQAEMLVDQMKYMVNPIKGIVDAKGILKNSLHIAAVQLQLLIGHIRNVFAIKDNLPRCELDKPQHQVRQRRLATAALASNGGDGRRGFVDGHVKMIQRNHRFFAAAQKAAALIDLGRITNL